MRENKARAKISTLKVPGALTSGNSRAIDIFFVEKATLTM